MTGLLSTRQGGVRGETRSSALWGKGGRRAAPVALCAIVLGVLVPCGGAAAGSSPDPAAPPAPGGTVYVPSDLLAAAQANPQKSFQVIVQGNKGRDTDQVADQLAKTAAEASQGDEVQKADDTLRQARADAINASKRAAQAQRDAAKAQSTAQARAAKAAASGKPGDRDAAAKAVQDAARKADTAAQAQQAATAAKAAAGQAQSNDNSAQLKLGAVVANIRDQQVTGEFSAISGVSVTLTGQQILGVVKRPSGLLSITSDAPVHAAGDAKWSSTQVWPFASQSADTWKSDKDPKVAANTPAIAIVDSGIQSRSDFGSRIVASVDLSTLPDNSPGDGRGHGTMVAGIAADGLPGITGGDPVANLVDIDVMDDQGMGLTSDIIRACQWILDHKQQYNIRVANFSLTSAITAPFYVDPLDRAVEQLWFNGVTVVTAAGNYGSAGAPSGVLFSPADDPFVITVGAADTSSSPDARKAAMAPWSAWGYTVDGFAKPELAAPGRYMVAPVPMDSTLVAARPDGVTTDGYMQLSGTSFAAPVVSAAAANILARNPSFTPDQVKGALLLSAKPMAKGVGLAGGVGLVQAKEAADRRDAPNPNGALEQFTLAGGGGYSFNTAAWNSAVSGNAAWNSASWNSAAWNSAAWNSAAWNSAAWNSAAWNSAAWNSAAWNSAAWNSDAGSDGAAGDPPATASVANLSSDDLATLLADPDLEPAALPGVEAPDTAPAATTTSTTTSVAAVTTPAPAVPAPPAGPADGLATGSVAGAIPAKK